MIQKGIRNPNADLAKIGFQTSENVYWNLDPQTLTQDALDQDEGILSHTGALCIKTGRFTGRSPKDRFIVKDEKTSKTVWWGNVNIPFEKNKFDALYTKVVNYLEKKEVYVRDVYACSLETFQLNIRAINEYPWSNQAGQTVQGKFIELTSESLKISTLFSHQHILTSLGFEF